LKTDAISAHGSGALGPRRRQYHADLHPRAQPGTVRRHESSRPRARPVSPGPNGATRGEYPRSGYPTTSVTQRPGHVRSKSEMLRARPDAFNRTTLQAAHDRPRYPVLGNYKLGRPGTCSAIMTALEGWS
jgi:hypothetical protein